MSQICGGGSNSTSSLTKVTLWNYLMTSNRPTYPKNCGFQIQIKLFWKLAHQKNAIFWSKKFRNSFENRQNFRKILIQNRQQMVQKTWKIVNIFKKRKIPPLRSQTVFFLKFKRSSQQAKVRLAAESGTLLFLKIFFAVLESTIKKMKHCTTQNLRYQQPIFVLFFLVIF